MISHGRQLAKLPTSEVYYATLKNHRTDKVDQNKYM